MLSHVLPHIGGFRPRVFPYFTNKIPKASTYQSSTEAEEGLTQYAWRSIDTISYCDMDERINIKRSIWDEVHAFH
jgi:hypothetical protein